MTAAERAWVRRLQKVLDVCPSTRLGFYTIGDRSISIYDKSRGVDDDESGRDLCQIVDEFDAQLGELRFPSPVHATCG